MHYTGNSQHAGGKSNVKNDETQSSKGPSETCHPRAFRSPRMHQGPPRPHLRRPGLVGRLLACRPHNIPLPPPRCPCTTGNPCSVTHARCSADSVALCREGSEWCPLGGQLVYHLTYCPGTRGGGSLQRSSSRNSKGVRLLYKHVSGRGRERSGAPHPGWGRERNATPSCSDACLSL